MNRRGFLQSVAGMGGLALLGRWDEVLASPATASRILIVVHLAGGNDGLNTIVPRDGLYRKARPTLGLRDDEVLPLASGLSLHRAMEPLQALWDARKLAIVNGAGYDQPNRSHFRSAEIWQTGQPQTAPTTGWLGSYLDASGKRGISVDASLNRSLWSLKENVLSVDTPDSFRFSEEDSEVLASLDDLYRTQTVSPHLSHTWQQLQDAIRRLGGTQKASGLPKTDAGKAMATVLELMPMADVYHVSMKGFDTHSDQRPRQAKALGEVAHALAAFWSELEQRQLADRTTMLVYSEFGRRVEENASGGTDHGTAGPVFVLGNVKGGLYGDYPSLSNLDEGDLRHTVDFRRVYASVLEGWLSTDSRAVLGARFDPLPLFA